MKKINIGVPVITLILGVLIGLLLYFLFDFSASDLMHGSYVDNTATIKKELAEKEALHQTKITELENANQKLHKDLSIVKEELASIKSKTKKREATIKKMIEPKGMSAKELLAKVARPDSVDNSLIPCDSLVHEVSQYIEESAIKDSLYDSQIAKLDSTIAIKDSIIRLDKEMNIQLSNTVSNLLNQHEILFKENKTLRKQFKRQKLKNKLVSVGLMILSATMAIKLSH
jgi:hypothetical protein